MIANRVKTVNTLGLGLSGAEETHLFILKKKITVVGPWCLAKTIGVVSLSKKNRDTK